MTGEQIFEDLINLSSCGLVTDYITVSVDLDPADLPAVVQLHNISHSIFRAY